jgi:hypothetical protein
LELEEKNNESKRKISGVKLFFSGILLIVSAVLIFYYILHGVYGRFETSEMLPNFHVLESQFLHKNKVAAILFSNYTQNMLPSDGLWIKKNISTWEKFLNDKHDSYDVINDQTIEKGGVSNYDVLILPDCKSLSDKEIVEIKKYLENGGSIFATGGTATYSDNGKWRGWDFFTQVFGVKFTQEIKYDSLTKIHTLRGGIPLTANIPTGFHLRIATWDVPIEVEVLDPRTTQVSYWYNPNKKSGLVREEIKNSAGIVNGNYGKGRFVWMGFAVNSILGSREDYVNFERLFNNSIDWLTHGPVAYVKDWPNGYDAAAILISSISGTEQNIDSLTAILRENDLSALFYVSPKKMNSKVDLIVRLKKFGEVIPKVIINQKKSADKIGNYKDEITLLKNSRIKLENILNRKVNGIYLDSTTITDSLLSHLSKAGFDYFLTDSSSNRSVPQIYSLSSGNLIKFTNTARDDNYIINILGLKNPDFQFYTYQEDVDRILFEGGLYICSIHPNIQMQPDYSHILRQLIGDINQKNVWLTNITEVKNWYVKRGNIEIKVDRRGERRVAFNVTNLGMEPVKDLIINLDLNDNSNNISVDEEIIGTKPVQYRFLKDKRIVYFHIKKLEPHESRTYYVDYDKINI